MGLLLYAAKDDNMHATVGCPVDRIDMSAQLHSNGLVFLLGVTACAAAVAAAGSAEAVPSGPTKAATESCESAVTEAVREARGRNAQHVQFMGTKHASSSTQPDETAVKGEGLYRGVAGSMPFTYSCSFNAKTNEATGVIFSDKGELPSSTEKPWQPDLTNISPDACEAAAAAALKDKYPRVGRIAFGSDSRELKPAPNAHTSLEGQGGVERAPGMHSVPFTYRCEFDTASGKILNVQTSTQ